MVDCAQGHVTEFRDTFRFSRLARFTFFELTLGSAQAIFEEADFSEVTLVLFVEPLNMVLSYFLNDSQSSVSFQRIK